MKKSYRKPKKITPKRLENIALYYLNRFESSAANLERVLKKRVKKAALFHEVEYKTTDAWIHTTIQTMKKMGYIDDTRYAKNQTRQMLQEGKSKKFIISKLRSKGVCSETIDQIIRPLDDDSQHQAALTFARKKLLGPFSVSNKKRENREKQLASFARAGFDYQTAKKILEIKKIETS